MELLLCPRNGGAYRRFQRPHELLQLLSSLNTFIFVSIPVLQPASGYRFIPEPNSLVQRVASEKYTQFS